MALKFGQSTEIVLMRKAFNDRHILKRTKMELI